VCTSEAEETSSSFNMDEKIAEIYLDVVCRLLVVVTQLGDYLDINLSN